MGKNNRQKQEGFFQSLIQVHSFNIRDFRASSADKLSLSLLFELQEQFGELITVVKIDSYQTAFEDVAAILTGIECKYMSLCLVFSILPNFYEIKTNFPQNYNV